VAVGQHPSRTKLDERHFDRHPTFGDQQCTCRRRVISDWITSMPIPAVEDRGSTASGGAGASVATPIGLTSDEARRRLERFGPNAMPDTSAHPLRMAFEKFWTPVPWMLEAAIVLELSLGKTVEASVIALLLIFNAALGYFQESHAQATLTALKSRLAMTASVRREGAWTNAPTAELAPGDVVKLSLGGLVPADALIKGGEILLDQSMLTGESVPTEARAGAQAYAGALVRRGEAVAEVTATGARTKFGKIAEFVLSAYVVSS
jgi:H+-transporting ATPase